MLNCKLFVIFVAAVFCLFLTNCSKATNDEWKPNIDGLDISYKQDIVSICYSVWHHHALEIGVYNISEILSENPYYPNWGGLHSFHYWGEPYLGYYTPDDPEIIRIHMKQLHEARIDFLVLDWTNYSKGAPSHVMRTTKSLLNTTVKMREEGKDTPYITFWIRVEAGHNGDVGVRQIFREYYWAGEYSGVFVYYHDKPLIFTSHRDDSWKKKDLLYNFTVRPMWGLQRELDEGEWSFLQPYPQNITMLNGEPEHVSVSAGIQRSYMSSSDAITRAGGRTFAEQWRTVFEVRPKVVTITWWNEWIAQRFEDDDGNSMFVDGYTPEASRDIEPMRDKNLNIPTEFPDKEFNLSVFEEVMIKRGLHWDQMAYHLDVDKSEVDMMQKGNVPSDETMKVLEDFLRTQGQHGNLYYKWMKQYILAYKNDKPFPEGLVQW